MKDFLLGVITGQKKDAVSRTIGFMLYLLSLIYSGILALRFCAYRMRIMKPGKHGIKVISVGNMTVGGTGKTPLVEKICEYLLKEKKRAAIISRGYKGMHSSHGFIADEPQMIKTRFPQAQVIINKDRILALKLARGEMGCEVAVLDDAFGNLKIKKDLDIVCIDCLNPFGYGYVLPRGLLRLPFCYLSKAHIFILTHVDQAPEKVASIINRLSRYNKKAEIFKSSHVPDSIYNIVNAKKAEPASLQDKKVVLLSAIAKPELFQKTVQSLGARVIKSFCFQDHHAFTEQQIKEIIAKTIELKVKYIITTAKDEPRIKAVMSFNDQNIEIIVLTIKLKVEKDEGRFLERISALFAN